MKWRLLGVGVVALAFVAAPATAASATTGVVVNLEDCGDNGSITVPSGESITIAGIGFAQGTYGLIKDFLLKEHTTLTISNGTTVVYDLSNEWGAPQQSPTFWSTRLPDTDLGITLASGESIDVAYDITFSQPLLVAFPPVGPSGDNGPFLIREDGPLGCTITGS